MISRNVTAQQSLSGIRRSFLRFIDILADGVSNGKACIWGQTPFRDTDDNGRITRVGKVGDNRFNMVGVAWFKASDARLLGSLIKDRYGKEGFEDLFWDDVVNENLNKLDLVVHEIKAEQITEIDTVEELKAVDNTYL